MQNTLLLIEFLLEAKNPDVPQKCESQGSTLAMSLLVGTLSRIVVDAVTQCNLSTRTSFRGNYILGINTLSIT